MVAFIKTASGVTFFESTAQGRQAHMVAKDHVQYYKIVEALLDPETTIDEVKSLVDLSESFKEWSKGNLEMKENSQILYKGYRIASSLEDRLLDMILTTEEDASVAIESLVNFIEKLYQNPSATAINELYLFLDACDLPIMKDGNFLAYKKVRHDYTSIHASPDGTHMGHSIGTAPSMPRFAVDDDRSKTCSEGLHCCSFEYLEHYGGGANSEDRIIIVSVNPADVVSVPADYDNQKMRVCGYIVVDEIPNDGFTRIVKFLGGKREEGWIRETIKTLREIYEGMTQKEGTTLDEDVIENLNDAQWVSFATKVCEKFFGPDLGAKPLTEMEDKDAFIDKYGYRLQDVLQFINNWTL